MNSIDIIIIAIVGLSGILGIYWGIIRQVLSIVGLVAGIVLASRYGPAVADWLSSFISDDRVAQAIGFFGVLLGTSALASFLASLLHRFAGLLFLGWADHLAGGVLGAVQGSMFVVVLLTIAAASPNEGLSAALRDSQYAERFMQVFSFVLVLLPESLRRGAQIFFGVG